MFFFRDKPHKKHFTDKEQGRTDVKVESSMGKLPLDTLLANNLQHIRKTLGTSPDIIIRQFKVGSVENQVAVIYVDGLIDKKVVGDLVDAAGDALKSMTAEKNLFDVIKNHVLAMGEVNVNRDWDALVLSVLSGNTVFLIDGWAEAIIGSTKGGEQRAVSEPTSQVVIRGPRDGFTETIGTNISLVRRRIKSPDLRLETMRIGEVTQTDVAIMYIKGIVNDKIVQEVKKRLLDIKIDAILETGYIESFIEDEKFSPFPTVHNTERPDNAAGNLLEGKVLIFVDGTPFVLITPVTFFSFFQATEDYYQRFQVASAIRLVRYVSFLIAMFVPSIYIAAITFHQEMIPTSLLISLAAQRESVPFPAFIEAIIMEFTFEILREAGIRMPRAIGQAVSIVGALVLGQAAVEAGIISSAMVIVVALTGIASFSSPSFSLALSVRLIRFVIMIAAAFMGFYGISIVSIILIAHMCSLRSFGIPYMEPLAPFILEEQKDTLIRMPWSSLITRPRLFSPKNRIRQGENSQQPPPTHDD